MSTITEFTALNGLSADSNGVFRVGDAAPFNYSDGEQAERVLHDILTRAADLSSNSLELDQQIVDWPSEYHLSSTRANLLRPLKLEGVTRVLELGCGCGSISRYLGEQKGLQVDSVEGSPTRAALAALRCKDLPNVTISTGNFNDMQFPLAHYDLVLFVGVTEYAGRFSERDTDQQALQDLLALAKRAAKADGVVLVAIENRLGLKYLLGASEDHYGQAYVGLKDYPDSTGIRTYNRSEWLAQIATAEFAFKQFIYPFPDYKIPTLLVNETFLENARLASEAAQVSDVSQSSDRLAKLLSRVRSRDYLQKFKLGDDEATMWPAVEQAGILPSLANSFLILLANQPARLSQLADFEFCEFPEQQHAYLAAQPEPPVERGAEQAKANSAVVIESLRTQSTRQQARAEQLQHDLAAKVHQLTTLQARLDIVTRSLGWRCLNKLRKLLGLPTIT